MSDYVLRGLALPDDSYQVKQTSKIELKGLNLPKKKTAQTEDSTNDALALLDSLSVSKQLAIPDSVKPSSVGDNTERSVTSTSQKSSPAKKADLSILEQLLIPNDLLPSERIAKSKPTSTTKKQTPVSEVLSGLQPSTVTRTTTERSKVDYNLKGLDVSITSRRRVSYSTSADGTQSITKTYSIGAVVAPKDVTTDKLNTAIEKIKNWDRKVGALGAELKNQKSGEGTGHDAIITRSQQVVRAKKDATESRDDAIKAYTDVMQELKSTFENTGTESSKAAKYRELYNEMETKFNETQQKDERIWIQVTDYAKDVMSSDGFRTFVSLVNPVSVFK